MLESFLWPFSLPLPSLFPFCFLFLSLTLLNGTGIWVLQHLIYTRQTDCHWATPCALCPFYLEIHYRSVVQAVLELTVNPDSACIPNLLVSNFRGDRMTGLCHWAALDGSLLTVVTFRNILMYLWNVLFYFIRDNITKYLRKFCLKKNIQKGKGSTYLRKEKNHGKKKSINKIAIYNLILFLITNGHLLNYEYILKFLRHKFSNRKISWISKDFAKFVSYSNCNN